MICNGGDWAEEVCTSHRLFPSSQARSSTTITRRRTARRASTTERNRPYLCVDLAASEPGDGAENEHSAKVYLSFRWHGVISFTGKANTETVKGDLEICVNQHSAYGVGREAVLPGVGELSGLLLRPADASN